MARDERHTTRRTKRTGGVNTKGLRHVQRRVLVSLFHLSWDESKRRDKGLGHHDVWVLWEPKRDHMPNGTEAERVAASKALKSLEKRRLVMVRRHEGGRAHAVRLTSPGLDLAFELHSGAVVAEERRARLAAQLPSDVSAFVPKAYMELCSHKPDADRRQLLQRFVAVYDTYTSGDDGVPPGSTPALTELYELHRALTS